MNALENAMAIYHGEQPDYYGDIFPALASVRDPIAAAYRTPRDGKEHPDEWGCVMVWLPEAPGRHPHVTKDNAVIKDIEHWERDLRIPSLSGWDWSEAEAQAKAADRKEKMVCVTSGGGLFERSHHLMGMEDALMNYLLYPDEMAGLLRKIADYKMELIRLYEKHIHPDIIFYHDDWGSKSNLFLPPAVWRSIIRPLQKEIADCIHDCGMIYMHHADCICQPIVNDMVEIGVDIWQGVIAQNDIPEIQRITGGKLCMVGGIDAPKVDTPSSTEEEIRAEVRRAIDTYCPGGRFFPAVPNGRCLREWNNQILQDELIKYGREFAEKQR